MAAKEADSSDYRGKSKHGSLQSTGLTQYFSKRSFLFEKLFEGYGLTGVNYSSWLLHGLSSSSILSCNVGRLHKAPSKWNSWLASSPGAMTTCSPEADLWSLAVLVGWIVWIESLSPWHDSSCWDRSSCSSMEFGTLKLTARQIRSWASS